MYEEEKRQDRRVQRTKRAIRNAFLQLLAEKEVEKISVKEIAEIYGISESKTASVLFRMRNELKNFFEKEGAAL